jgi:hypothetical protein
MINMWLPTQKHKCVMHLIALDTCSEIFLLQRCHNDPDKELISIA